MRPTNDTPAATRVDHVLIAVPDFREAAERLLQEDGLAAVEGGRHTGWGTANWIVPLGDSYLELVGVIDVETAAQNRFGRRVLRALDAGGGPFAWCVAPGDFQGTVARLGLAVSRGSRIRPDGVTLGWRTAGLETALEDPTRPFFIAWDLPSPDDHPGRMAATHRAHPRGIAWVDVAGDPALVAAWIDDPGLPVRVRSGMPTLLGVGVATPDGEIALP